MTGKKGRRVDYRLAALTLCSVLALAGYLATIDPAQQPETTQHSELTAADATANSQTTRFATARPLQTLSTITTGQGATAPHTPDAVGIDSTEASVNSDDARSKMSSDLLAHLDDGGGGDVRVIVQTRGDADDPRANLRSIRDWALERHESDDDVQLLEIIGAAVISVDSAELIELASRGDVTRVSLDAPIRPSSHNMPAVVTGADQVWSSDFPGGGFDGSGVTVAVIDSGIDDKHMDFKKGASVDRVDLIETVARDGYGHGTHVAGIVAGSGDSFNGNSGKKKNEEPLENPSRGIAPGCTILALRVLDEDGSGLTSTVIEAIEYAISQQQAQNIRVLNLSLGHPVFESYLSDPLTLACAAAVEAGIAVVASVGNNGSSDGNPAYGTVNSPANAPWVIGVGASKGNGTVSRSDDEVAAFSSRGPTPIDGIIKPDLVAPGYGIISTAPVECLITTEYDVVVANEDSGNKLFAQLNGTSMAAPMVSGTLALLFQANPSLNPNTAKAILMYTAEKMTEPDILTQGSGHLNTEGAVRLARAIRQDSDTLAPGEFWLDADSPEAASGMLAPFSTIDGEKVFFGSALTQGDTILWTYGVVLDPNAVWGNGTAWGDTILWTYNEPWFDPLMAYKLPAFGDTILWTYTSGEAILWADTILWTYTDFPDITPTDFTLPDTILWTYSELFNEWSAAMVDPLSISPNNERVAIFGEASNESYDFGGPGSWFFPESP